MLCQYSSDLQVESISSSRYFINDIILLFSGKDAEKSKYYKE